jgi:hypothetical protein
MLVQFPILYSAVLQQAVLVLNTTLLISILAFSELSDVVWLKQVKQQLKDFYPLFAALFVILGFAIYKTVAK